MGLDICNVGPIWRWLDYIGNTLPDGIIRDHRYGCRRPVAATHHHPHRRCIRLSPVLDTLVTVLSKSGLCGKSTVFTYDTGFLGMLLNRLRRSSLFFYKNDIASQRGLSHTAELVNSSALQRCLLRLKRGTPGREKRVSLEKSRKKYMAGSVQFRIHRALRVISERSVLLRPAFVAGIRMWSHSDAPRSPVVAVWADLSAKVDEEVWSAHRRSSGARVLWSHCCVRVVHGYPSPPPSPALHVTTARPCPSSLRTSTGLLIILWSI